MDDAIFSKIHRINYLMEEVDSVYHQAALKLGVSDSVLNVLYALLDYGGSAPLTNVVKSSGCSKQTVNSALRGLEKDGYIYLEKSGGRSKNVCLTEGGKEFAERTAGRLFEAEKDVYGAWSEGEMDAHIGLLERYAEALRARVSAL